MGTVIAFPAHIPAIYAGEAEARAYFRLCRFLFDRALVEDDAREAMTQVEDVLGYPLPPFADTRLRKERDDLAVVMIGLAFERFVARREHALVMGER